MKTKILFGIPPKTHINLAMDELEGLTNLGYLCEKSTYSRNNPSLNVISKLWGVISNAIIILKKVRKHKSDLLYLNSRFGLAGLTRDFITIFILKTFYWGKISLVVKTHGSDLDLISKKSFLFKKIVMPYLINNVDVWFFLSQDEKNQIANKFPNLGKNAHVTCNIINPNRSLVSKEFLSKYVPNDNRFKFFFAGRMIPEKGIFSIVKAIPHFEFKNKCAFIMSGDGSFFNELASLIKELNLEDTVYLTGFVPEEKCDHFYANTDALVFPTYFDEGFPMTLFKALANGMPIITTKIRAAKDHLKSPQNCLWVDGKSEQSVAEALNRLYTDDNLRKTMSKNNIQLGGNFTQQAVCLEMHKVFASLG